MRLARFTPSVSLVLSLPWADDGAGEPIGAGPSPTTPAADVSVLSTGRSSWAASCPILGGMNSGGGARARRTWTGAALETDGLSRSFGGRPAVDGLTFD